MAAREGAAASMARNKTMEMPKRDLEGNSGYKPPRCLGELGLSLSRSAYRPYRL